MSRDLRCNRCLGMGYVGRWRMTARGKAWKLEACRRCYGTGQCHPEQRNASYTFKRAGGDS